MDQQSRRDLFRVTGAGPRIGCQSSVCSRRGFDTAGGGRAGAAEPACYAE